ncbi:glycosyltransferase, partial [Acinetobacter baumannii]
KGFEDRVAELHNRHGNVVFTGAQYGEDKRRTFAAATFFVLPSMSEGLPMSVLEAWAAGKPVLMTPECNLPAGFDSGAALEIGFDEESIRRGLASA